MWFWAEKVCFEVVDATCFFQETQTLPRLNLFGNFTVKKMIRVITSNSTYSL